VNDELAFLKERCARLELLHQVGHVLLSTLDPTEALNLILHQAVRLTRASSGSLILVNPTTSLLEIQAAIGLPESAAQLKLRLGEGITGWVAKTGQPARVGQVKNDPRYVCIWPKASSELAVPLQAAGEVLGVLNVDSDTVEAFRPEDQELLEAFATKAAKVIQNTWLHEQIRLKARMFEGLANVSRTINSTLSLHEALQAIARETCGLMTAKVCALHLLDDHHHWLDLKASFGAGRAYLTKARLSADESLLGVVVRRKKPLQLDNVQTSSCYQNRTVARQEGLVSVLSVPLLFSNQAIGTLSVYKGEQHTFSNEEIRVLSSLAELSAIAIEKARLYERIVAVEDQLRQNERLSALGLLAAEVAHEIRNPLTVLKMLFHSLNLNFPANDPRTQDTRIIGEKMDQLNRIVERVLSFARNAEPKFGPVNLNHILTELTVISRPKLRAHDVQLVPKLDPTLPSIEADAAQLEQAFLNLMLNAIQAMPKGGTLTLVTTRKKGGRTDSTSRHVLVEFKDTGEGITQTQRKHAFSSILSSKKAGGTGLGLVMVRRVVETHQGTLSIQSKAGKGTSIRITLPRSRVG
jgi:signal transduction histidine kinase